MAKKTKSTNKEKKAVKSPKKASVKKTADKKPSKGLVYDEVLAERDGLNGKMYLFFINGKEVWLSKSNINKMDKKSKTLDIPSWLRKMKDI